MWIKNTEYKIQKYICDNNLKIKQSLKNRLLLPTLNSKKKLTRTSKNSP